MTITPLEAFDHEGFTIEIHPDFDVPSPRDDYDNLGTMVTAINGYRPAEKDAPVPGPELDAILADPGTVWLPIWGYIHSGMTLTAGPRIGQFADLWDSGQAGVIYVEREGWQKEYRRKRLTKKLAEEIKAVLRQEVDTYSEWASGEVYGYVVKDKDGEEVDSCWGFYGYDYCAQMARESASWFAKEAQAA